LMLDNMVRNWQRVCALSRPFEPPDSGHAYPDILINK